MAEGQYQGKLVWKDQKGWSPMVITYSLEMIPSQNFPSRSQPSKKGFLAKPSQALAFQLIDSDQIHIRTLFLVTFYDKIFFLVFKWVQLEIFRAKQNQKCSNPSRAKKITCSNCSSSELILLSTYFPTSTLVHNQKIMKLMELPFLLQVSSCSFYIHCKHGCDWFVCVFLCHNGSCCGKSEKRQIECWIQICW